MRYFFLIIITLLFACNSQKEQEFEKLTQDKFLATEILQKVNPSGLNPLGALVEFSTLVPCRVSMIIEGKEPLQHSFENFGTQHYLKVVGLYADTTNSVKLTLTDARGNYCEVPLLIKTGVLPEWTPTMTVEKIDTSKMQQGWHFAEIGVARVMHDDFISCPVIFDNNGDARWILDLRYEPVQWAFEREAGLFRAGGGVFVNFWDLLGSKVSAIRIPYSHLHHDIQQAANDSYVALIDKPGKVITKNGQQLNSVEDHAVQMAKNGAMVREWDFTEILDVQRIIVMDGGNDWLHTNSIWWDNNSESIIVSGRNQGVFKVDKDNNLKWIITTHKGWNNQKGLLTAVNANGVAYTEAVQMGDVDAPDGFSWPYSQHAAMVMPSGNVFIFDNGANRNYSFANNYSRAVEYQIDEANMTIKQVWVWSGKEGNHFSFIISDVDYDPVTKNRLITSGQEGKIIEVTDGGEEVFKAQINFKNIKGVINQWAGFDIMYRSERMKLYDK